MVGKAAKDHQTTLLILMADLVAVAVVPIVPMALVVAVATQEVTEEKKRVSDS